MGGWAGNFQDYLARMHAFTSNSKHSNLNWMLEKCQILLSLQEMDLEVREAKLAEEHACGLHSFNGRDLSAELGELHMRVARVEDECTAEAGKLSMFVIEASNALVSLGRLPLSKILPSSQRRLRRSW
jgi:hypothetical protein